MTAAAFVRGGCLGGLTALCLSGLPRSAGGQVVRGTVVDPTGRALSGVAVLLVDGAERPTVRTLTDGAGKFRLSAPSPGTYRLRTLRIGYKPSASLSITLDAASTIDEKVVLSAIPVGLDTVRITDQTACSSMSAAAAATILTVWEQARTALTAARLTAGGRVIAATTLSFQRSLDPANGRVRAQSASARTEYVHEPWRARSPDSLRRAGYVTRDAGGDATFYAPGLDMLLDPAFVEDHCFRIGKQSDDRSVVLEFEPARQRARVAEIAGALVIDRRTAELRKLDFRYVNVSREEAAYARGEVEYARLTNGGWVISRWTIQMPVLERSVAAASFLGQRLNQDEVRVNELQVSGGVVTAVVARQDTLWLRPPIRLAGSVTDSTTGEPVAGARVVLSGTSAAATTDDRGRFLIDALVPGAYTVELQTPALDSLGAVHSTPIVVTDSATPLEIKAPSVTDLRAGLCGAGRLDEPGIVVGHVTQRADGVARAVRVSAVWQALSLEEPAPGRLSVTDARRSREARAAGDGTFRLCGVPIGTDLRIYASGEGTETPSPTVLRITSPARFARVDLTLEAIGQGGAVYAGVVLTDSTERPVSEAEIAFPDLNRSTTTDALGTFRLDSVPPGDHRVTIRRIGFAPVMTSVSFRPGQRREQKILLARVVTLDSIRVEATALDRAMVSFEDHRRIGLGSFLTRAELAKHDGLTSAAVLQTLRGLRLAQGRGNGSAWVVGSHGTQSLAGTSLRRGDATDRAAGARPACYALVYLDGRVAYSGREDEPLFNVNSVRPSDLEAVEYYGGPSETPGAYAGLHSTCGILVLWSRRR